MRVYAKTIMYGLLAALLIKPYISVCVWMWLLMGGAR